METYQEFLNRVSKFEKREFGIGEQDFKPSEGVLQKVGLNNCFSPFAGDTVVFKIYKKDRDKINAYVDQLYSEAPECFSERLHPHTIHMTLHDLTTLPDCPSLSCAEELVNHKVENFNKLFELKSKQAFEVPGISSGIRMRTNFMINMVNTSVVLCLVPDTADDYKKLISLYTIIDENVIKLPYPFTPHVTLAYYNRNGFNIHSANKLKVLITNLNVHDSFTIFLDPKNLVYQKFLSMNYFVDKLDLI